MRPVAARRVLEVVEEEVDRFLAGPADRGLRRRSDERLLVHLGRVDGIGDLFAVANRDPLFSPDRVGTRLPEGVVEVRVVAA